MKPGNKWCTRCQHEHIPEMPPATFACADCGFGSWSIEVATDHGRRLPRHTVILMIHDSVDQEPTLKRIKGFNCVRAHLTRNGNNSICGHLGYANPLPGPIPLEDLPLCGHCRKLEPDA